MLPPAHVRASDFDVTAVVGAWGTPRRLVPVDVGKSCLESFDLAAGIEKVGEHAPVLENFEADPIVTGEAFFGTKRKRPTLPGEPGEVASRNGILEQCLDGLEIAHGI